MAKHNKYNKLQPDLGFASIPNDLVFWVDQKDQRFFNIEKAAKGIKSYKHALQDLAHYFNQIRIGQIRAEQKSISYFSKCWGWDWRKTLRFIVHCMSSLQDLDAGFYLKRLEALAKKQAQKIKNYVDKVRGKTVEPVEPDTKIEDDEIEEAFLAAMEEIAAVNPKAYKAKIKANLVKGDPKTLQHFQQFKQQYLENKRAREQELKAKSFDFEKALKSLTIGSKPLGKYVEREDGSGFDVWRKGQEHHLQPLTFISKQEIIEGFENAN